MRGTNEEKAQMRQVISNFLARLLKGTFPDKKHYAYFRHVDEGFEEVIHFVPLIVYLVHRIKERSDEVLITARQSGVILPPDFQAKIDFTMSYASAEAARGKHQRISNVARNLEETVVKAAIGDMGDTAAAKMGRAAAEAAAKAPPRMETPKSYAPQHPPPSPSAAASSSSAPSGVLRSQADLRDAIPRYQPLLWGDKVRNVSITGENGTIDGRGAEWWTPGSQGQADGSKNRLVISMGPLKSTVFTSEIS
eukprot:s3134_g7.t1